MGPCYSPCHWSKVVSCDYPQWFSLALSEGELPQPILHWPCSVVCRTWGSKLRLLQPALTWSHICSLLIPISSSSKGTELGTGSPVLQVLHQSDMEGPSGCQADGPACFCVSPNLWDGDRACLLLCSVCQSKEKRSRGSGLWTPSAPPWAQVGSCTHSSASRAAGHGGEPLPWRKELLLALQLLRFLQGLLSLSSWAWWNHLVLTQIPLLSLPLLSPFPLCCIRSLSSSAAWELHFFRCRQLGGSSRACMSC